MYVVRQETDELRVLYDGLTIASGIRPVLKLDDGSVCAPLAKSAGEAAGADALGAYTRYDFVYADADETFALTLTFTCYPDVLVASVALAATKDGIGVKQAGLAAFDGIALHVESLGQVDGLMANYLHKDWWTRPHFDTDVAALPPRTQSLLWRNGETYHHLLPVCGDVFKTELSGSQPKSDESAQSADKDGLQIQTAAYTAGYTNVETVTFVMASGDDPFALPDRNVAAGMHVLGTPFQTRAHKRYPEPLEYLGWCSWDAFYREVSADGILAKAAELQSKGLPFAWFIVDDGWLHNRDTMLLSFGPDPEKFPDGFAPLIRRLKDEFGVGWVGIWHTLHGYWQGIDPEGPLARSMAHALHTTRRGKVVPAPDASKAFAFWDAWHGELRDAGADFVKVDYQSGLRTFWNHERAIGDVARNAHSALEASVGKHFDGTVINCMGMATENLWHRTTAMTRNSDDFFPKSEGSFVEHALQNAYNAFYHAPLMWLDWDMWWTQHENAAIHAVMRAVSGGPVYVSDRVDETDAAQIWPLILSDGRLLRCDVPGMATADCLMRDPSVETIPLKLWNRVGETGVAAAFNVHGERQTVVGEVCAADVPDLEGDYFVAYEYFSRTARMVGYDEAIDITLAPNQAALYSFIPYGGAHTPIGLIDKYISVATIADWHATADRTLVLLLEGGTFAWVAEASPAQVRVNGRDVALEQGDGFLMVECGETEGPVWIEIVAADGVA